MLDDLDYAYYRRIGTELYAELLDDMDSQEHVALLGARNSGKSYVLHQLEEAAQSRSEARRPLICRLSWRDCANRNANQFLEYLSDRLGVADCANSPDGTLAGHISSQLHAYAAANHSPLWIFVQDIAGFPRPIARQLLLALRQAKNSYKIGSQLSVIVTGSADFLPLTLGPDSPYRDAKRLVVAGFDEAATFKFVQERLTNLRDSLKIPSHVSDERVFTAKEAAEVYRALYAETGGSAHLLQEIIATVVRQPYDFDDVNACLTWQSREMIAYVRRYMDSYVIEDHYSLMMMREIETVPYDFDLLLEVFNRGDNQVLIPAALRPHALEVSGAILCDQSGYARIASSILRRFFDFMLSPRHIADVYACQGRWEEAWGEYVNANVIERPVSGHERVKLREALLSWEGHLLDPKEERSEHIVSHFMKGMRFLYVFDAGGLFDTNSGPVPGSVFGVQSPSELPLDDASPSRLTYREEHKITIGGAGMSFLLVLVSKEAGQEMNHIEVEGLKETVQRFWRAYTHALKTEYQLTVGELRERHLKVIETVNREMLADPFDMGKVVKKTAEALVTEARYRRIQICLVDAVRERIQAVASAYQPGEKDFYKPTDYRLSDTDQDVQPWVVKEGRAIVIEDALSPNQILPILQGQSRVLDMKAFAVVPMLIDGEVIGTLHFELEGGRVPGMEERRLFEIFAGQTAVMFRQAMRLQLLEGTVNALNDEVQILNPRLRPLYRNKKASEKLLSTDARGEQWLSGTDEYEMAERFAGAESLPEIEHATELEEGDRLQFFITTESDQRKKAFDWQIAPLEDFRSRLHPFKADGRIGYVEQVHSLDGIYTVLNDLKSWLKQGGVEDTANAILDTYTGYGYAWARIYLCDIRENRDILRSFVEHGLVLAENKRWFRRGGVVEYLDHTTPTIWQLIMGDEEPAIYKVEEGRRMRSEADRRDGILRFSVGDLDYREQMERSRLEEWIEGPLVVGKRRIGLLSMAMPSKWKILPERWALLKLSLQCMALALDDALRAERQLHEAKLLSRNIFHNYQNPLAAARTYVDSYLSREDKGTLDPSRRRRFIEGIGEQLKRMEKVADQYLTYGREFLPIASRYDLIAELHCIAGIANTDSQLRGVYVHISDTLPQLRLDSDKAALADILQELISNAYKAGARDILLSASEHSNMVRIEIRDDGPGIPAEILGRLWEADPMKSSGGTGLGLAICKQRARALGGDINLVSNSNGQRGTAFELSIPKDFNQA